MKINPVIWAIFLFVGIAICQENYSQWAHSKVITINTTSTGANVTGGVTNFPLLVRLTSANSDILSQSLNRGADIRFTDSAGTVRLKHQRERWDSAGSAAEFWVLVPSIAGNANTSIRIYWGKSGAADSSNGAGVFDTANGFVGVWHLGDASGVSPRPSAVAGAPSAQLRNFPTSGYVAPVGVIGLADTLRSASAAGGNTIPGDDYLDIGFAADFSPNNYAGFSNFTTGFSYALWFYDAGPYTTERLLNLSDDSAGTGATTTSNRMVLMADKNASATDPNLSIRWGVSGTGYTAFDATPTYSLNAWHHVYVTKVAGTSGITMYLDGSVYATTANTNYPDPAVVTRNYFWIGRSGAVDRFWNGKFDEPELSKVARSADWVKLSYATQSQGATVVTVPPVSISGRVSAPNISMIRASGSSLFFTLPEGSIGGRIVVMDLAGRIVWSRTVNAGTREVSLGSQNPATKPAPGLYIARLASQDSNHKFQFASESKILLTP